jgi:protein required for attachment to host cells
MKSVKTWIVLADGARARVLLNEGPNKGLREVLTAQSETARLAGRDLMADAQGRVFDSAGQGRHAVEPRTDAKTLEEEKFLREVVRMLERGAQGGEYDRLVLCAAPRALGELRGLLPKAVQDRIAAELPKDLTNTPLDQVPRSLEGVLPV